MDKHISESHLGKRSRSDVRTARRTNELEVIQEISERLPISKCQKEKASQATLLRVALNYIKTREMMTVQKSGKRSPLGTCIPEGFSGFVMIVNIEGAIMFVTESITELVGPHIVDVVGQTVGDLVHTEDEEQIRHALDLHLLNQQKCFVIRMKKTMAPTVRSREKVEYKSVFVTSWLKRFSPSTSLDQESSVAAVMLCKTEFHIGFPEIVFGAYIDLDMDHSKHRFCKVDTKTPWLLGYREEDILNHSPDIFKHPNTRHTISDKQTKHWIHSKLLCDGEIWIPHVRILSGWGQWLWTTSHLKLVSSFNNEIIIVTGRMILLGPDDSEHTLPATETKQQILSSDLSDGVEEIIDDLLAATNTPPAMPESTSLCKSLLLSDTSQSEHLRASVTDISSSSGYSTSASSSPSVVSEYLDSLSPDLNLKTAEVDNNVGTRTCSNMTLYSSFSSELSPFEACDTEFMYSLFD
jgi:hypothetical protein